LQVSFAFRVYGFAKRKKSFSVTSLVGHKDLDFEHLVSSNKKVRLVGGGLNDAGHLDSRIAIPGENTSCSHSIAKQEKIILLAIYPPGSLISLFHPSHIAAKIIIF
jgi:hypothetical protein